MILVSHQVNLNQMIKKLTSQKLSIYYGNSFYFKFFLLVITFFVRGKNDFGLKPKSKKD